MRIATHSFLSFPFSWNVFFHSQAFNVYVSFMLLKVNLFVAKYCRLSCIYQPFHSMSLIGAFHPLTFKVIIDKYLFTDIWNLVFRWIICFSIVPLFVCVCMCVLFLMVGKHPFILCLCPLLFSSCECSLWFWFMIDLFSKHVNAFMYLLVLAW